MRQGGRLDNDDISLSIMIMIIMMIMIMMMFRGGRLEVVGWIIGFRN